MRLLARASPLPLYSPSVVITDTSKNTSSSSLPMTTASRPRKRLSILRNTRPHTHHDISRPYPHVGDHGHGHRGHPHGHGHLGHGHPTAHRTTTVFTPPVPHTKAKLRPPPLTNLHHPPRDRAQGLTQSSSRRQGGGFNPFNRRAAATGTPPPSPLTPLARGGTGSGFGVRLERAFSSTPTGTGAAQPESSSAPATLRAVPAGLGLEGGSGAGGLAFPTSPLSTTFEAGDSRGVSTLSLGKNSRHQRTLSTKVRSLLVGLVQRCREDSEAALAALEWEEAEAEMDAAAARPGTPLPPSGTGGAPLRPHRSPGAASFHATTKLTPITPTRSSSPLSRAASYASRDSAALSPAAAPPLLVRPRTRRGLRRMGNGHRHAGCSDLHSESEDDFEADDENDSGEAPVEGSVEQSGAALRPSTPFGLHPRQPSVATSTASDERPTSALSVCMPVISHRSRSVLSHRRPAFISVDSSPKADLISIDGSAHPSILIERPSVDLPMGPVSAPLRPSPTWTTIAGGDNPKLPRPHSSPSASIEMCRPSTDSGSVARPSMDTTFSLTLSHMSRGSRSSAARSTGTSVSRALELESRFSDTSDSEVDEPPSVDMHGDLRSMDGHAGHSPGPGGGGSVRARPTSPFRRPWSSMPDLVREQLRALAARRGKSGELEQ